MSVPIGETIEYHETPVTFEVLNAFRKATRAQYVRGISPTICTLFRLGEYEWLARLGIEIRELLHGDQEYEFFSPVIVGDPVRVITKLASWKERKMAERSMIFLGMESEIFNKETLVVRARTTFVVRRFLTGNAA